MDIHFCDLCGARVTDVDLRGGHGIRKEYDVICATCVELGHSKEWLASHQRGKVASNASQPAVAALAANNSNKQSPVVTLARDRVETLEEGEDSPTVTPQVVSSEEPAVGADNDADHELLNQVNSNDTDRQQVNQFAAAASSFSALAATNHKVDAAADVEEYTEQGEGLSDESTAAPILADPESDQKVGQETAKSADEEAGDSPFEFNDDTKADSSQKDETLPGYRPPLINDKPVGDNKKKSSPSNAAARKSGANNKAQSANGKSGSKASRSAKGPSRKVNKNKNILMMTAVSIGILTMIMLIVVQANKKPRKEQPETIQVDLSENVKSAIKEAKFNVTKALKSGSLKECEAARTQIQAIMPEISKFERVATSQNPPWTQEDMGNYLKNIGWNDLFSLVIPLNQKIARLKAPGGGN